MEGWKMGRRKGNGRVEDGKEEEWKGGRWEGGRGMEGGEWEVVFVRFRFRVIL